MSTFYIRELAQNVLNRAREKLTKTYQETLVGKDLYKASSKTQAAKFLGKITDVAVKNFTEFDGAIIVVKVNGIREINMHVVNLTDHDANYGWFYKSEEVR
jgi:hypothetical protein